MRLNLKDRVQAFLNPEPRYRIVNERPQERATTQNYTGGYATGYAGAHQTRLRTLQAWHRSSEGTEDDVLGSRDRDALRLECRDLWRNNEICRGAVDRFTEYAVWNGLYPQFQTSDQKWNDLAEKWWAEVYVPTANFTQAQGVSLITFQKLMVSHKILDGECGFILLDNGQLEAIESERIATPKSYTKDPKIMDGIALTANGIVRGYFVCNRKRGGSIDTTKFRYVPRENFVHCFSPGRIDQLRGIPVLAPAICKLRDYDETDEAVFSKVKADAKTWATRKTVTGLPNEQRRNAWSLTNSDGKDKQRIEKVEDLRILDMLSGESLESFQGKTPSAEYVPYLKHELQAIAACLNVSYEILMLIFTEGSFSSQRAALIHNRHTFHAWTDWVIESGINRICNWRIAKAMKEGALPPAPTEPVMDGGGNQIGEQSQWWRKSWSIPYLDWVDPQAQITADKESFNIGVTSLKRLNASKGQDRDDIFREKAEDIKRAKEIAAELGEGVTWQDIITTKIPGQTQGQAPQQKQEAETPARTQKEKPEPEEAEK